MSSPWNLIMVRSFSTASMKAGTIVFELDRRDRAVRVALIVAIVLVHLLLILWLISQRAPISSKRTNSLAVIGLLPGSDPGQPAKKAVEASRATPEKPSPIVQLAPLPSLDLATMDAGAVGSTGSGAAGGCALTEELRTAILADPASMAELASLPAGIRTEADAVMLWNGEWPDPGLQPNGNLTPRLRELVERLVAMAPAECRGMTWTGPQFIPIAQGQRFTMLVVGSGAWRWQDLIEPPASCAVGEFRDCAAVRQIEVGLTN